MLPARTKIVATIGPACWDEVTLRALLAAGMSVARFNFSHANYAETTARIALLRRLAAEPPVRHLAILADLQGPRIRVGVLPAAGLQLVAGTAVTLAVASAPDVIPVDYAGLPGDVAAGDTILLDDGLLALRVQTVDVAAGRIGCLVEVGGLLTAHKGINVPDRPLSVPALTDKDRRDLAFALAQGVDLVALSFVRSAADILATRALIAAQTDRPVPIIAKIEKPVAVSDFAAILAAADGIMVARGDLGVELPPEALPAIQKRLIAAANRAGKPVITATQMLDSMIRQPRPTRAEVTDVANAVLDGSDALMLSGETATGAYPLAALTMMARIIRAAETVFDYEGWTARLHGLSGPAGPPPTPAGSVAPAVAAVTEVLCEAADRIAEDLGAAAIVTLTRSGTSARLIAKYRPHGALIAVTDRPATARALALTWGVIPLLVPAFGDTLTTLAAAEAQACAAGLLTPGDCFVYTGGLPQPLPGQTTLLGVRVAGQTD